MVGVNRKARQPFIPRNMENRANPSITKIQFRR